MQLPYKYKFAWTFRVSDAEDPPIRARVSVRAAGGSPPSPRAMFSDKEPVDERIDEVEAARYRRAVEILQKATRSRKLRALWPNMEKLRSMYIDPSAAAAGAASNPLYSNVALAIRESLRVAPAVRHALNHAWRSLTTASGTWDAPTAPDVLNAWRYGKKTPRCGHTRGTWAHTGTRITQTNLLTSHNHPNPPRRSCTQARSGRKLEARRTLRLDRLSAGASKYR